jgi:nucleoside 2-deoxyribosyltransferase
MIVAILGKVGQVGRFPRIPGVSYHLPEDPIGVSGQNNEANFYTPRNMLAVNVCDAAVLVLSTGTERVSCFEAGIVSAKGKPLIVECERWDLLKIYEQIIKCSLAQSGSRKETIKILRYMAKGVQTDAKARV